MADAAGMRITKAQLVGLAITAVAAGALLVWSLLTTGDEPPIRVKGGSIHFELLHGSGKWESQGGGNDPKKWQVKGQLRASEDLLIYLAPVNPAHCGNQAVAKKKKTLKFVYDVDGAPHEITVQAKNKKTKVDSGDLDLTRVSAQDLAYTGAGFIKEVWIDTVKVCTFTTAADLDSILITEEP